MNKIINNVIFNKLHKIEIIKYKQLFKQYSLVNFYKKLKKIFKFKVYPNKITNKENNFYQKKKK